MQTRLVATGISAGETPAATVQAPFVSVAAPALPARPRIIGGLRIPDVHLATPRQRHAGRTAAAAGRRLDAAQTFSIGFGMLAIAAAWAMYNAFVPLKLKDLAIPTAIVGIIMGIDNICGFTIQPLCGILSDKVRTRWGRRLPFALFAIPLAALCLIAIAAAPNAPLTIAAVVAYAVLMSTCRAPVVALMPDVTASPARSKANGIINLMGSIGNVLALGGGSLLYRRYGMGVTFVAGAFVMVAAVAALTRLVHEPAEFRTRPGQKPVLPFVGWREFRDAAVPRVDLADADCRRSFRMMLLILFLYTMGSSAIETYFTLYATHDLGMDAAAASGGLVWFAVSGILFAIPAGWLGTRFGRKRTMSAGLALAIAALAPMPWVGAAAMLPYLAFAFGILWMMVLVNALPWATELGGVERTGTMTAYYYLATSGGAAVSPALFGLVQQATGSYRWMFLYAIAGFALALACMPFVSKGEATDAAAALRTTATLTSPSVTSPSVTSAQTMLMAGAATLPGIPVRRHVHTPLRTRPRRPQADTSSSVKHTVKRARTPFPWWAYAIAFTLFATAAVLMLQWSVMIVRGRTTPWEFLAKTVTTPGQFQFLLNLLVVSLVYMTLVFAINRFWIASGLLTVIAGVIAVLERMKVLVRSETIRPTDITLMASGGAGGMGDTVTNTPAGSGTAIAQMSVTVVLLLAVCALAAWFDGRRSLIATPRRFIGRIRRGVAAVLCAAMLVAFSADLGTTGSWANGFATAFGDKAKLWDSIEDAQSNGVAVGFLRLTRPKVMDEPAGYSQAAMRRIAQRYARQAAAINAGRSADLTDSTVIMILSESFSDPTRVPGITLNHDPMPFIRSLKRHTTSGLMLSSGYGGGTANLEFQALTGLSMANFNASLSSPYQQLVPQMGWAPSFNQIWNKDAAGSEAVHPYNPALYSRTANYRKFGFAKFYSQDDPLIADHAQRIDRSHYISDKTSYDTVLRLIDPDGTPSAGNRFIQLVTMQNHMGYENWYDRNQFKASSTNGTRLGDDEAMHINTYAKGMSITDQSTKAFLEALDRMDRPVTVIFYGDHLPSIYKHASADDRNSIPLHETDYFIWSNKATGRTGSDASAAGSPHASADNDAAYTSPNYLMAQTAEHLNARVSPYLAFLTAMHHAAPAMEPPVVNVTQGWTRIPAGTPLYLDASGRQFDPAKAPEATRRLLDDYRLIQYDITAGHGYLRQLGFMDMPNK
ncbi:LTA synthase family protein [Bifidobacterium leontopitheci]|uniref:Phosphoglycerol transferase n=1 Tax=Bifidobacterium leontopitheci TaxID=2650774 RepID=A0A6I1GPA8_9BIFI|nr:LTA synthase family protein [Bifidobacterium leontopitheci]KAB7791127.1 phosphoglycerol transferase [Bifidobacterium leontopitheci]